MDAPLPKPRACAEAPLAVPTIRMGGLGPLIRLP